MSEQAVAPIDRWSHSSLSLYLRNPLAFKKRNILKIYTASYGPTTFVGRAGHEALAKFFEGHRTGQPVSVAEAVEVGMIHLQNVSDTEVDFGKLGSREKMLADYNKAINAYFAELPRQEWVNWKILAVEQKIVREISDEQGPFPLPAVSVQDIVLEDPEGNIVIVDHKFVATYTDGNVDDGTKVMQALFAYHTVKAEYGRAPTRMIYSECKLATNKDGSPQVQPYDITFANHPDFFQVFRACYVGATIEVMRPDAQFLPNFSDMFDGQDSFESLRAGLIGVENVVAVPHKTKQPEFVDKAFTQSAATSVVNVHLEMEEKIRLKLLEFGLPVKMQTTYRGGSVALYTLEVARGVRMESIKKREADLALALEATTIRVLAPIMGTSLVGIEVPLVDRQPIPYWTEEDETRVLSERVAKVLENSTLNIPVGVDVYGQTVSKNLSDMPHLLVAGATGAGKSVMLNVAITALIEQNTPEQLGLVLIDPKRVELAQFKKAPHLLAPPIYEVMEAQATLAWLAKEMDVRYDLLEKSEVRNIDEYNQGAHEKMQRIVCVVDEFADLMLQQGNLMLPACETSIVRIAQKARAVGIHLIIGTQRPSVDVITGVIKANLPTRIAFMTSSKVDSLVILDQAGAEALTGKGDMLFQDPSTGSPQRLQGFLI